MFQLRVDDSSDDNADDKSEIRVEDSDSDGDIPPLLDANLHSPRASPKAMRVEDSDNSDCHSAGGNYLSDSSSPSEDEAPPPEKQPRTSHFSSARAELAGNAPLRARGLDKPIKASVYAKNGLSQERARRVLKQGRQPKLN